MLHGNVERLLRLKLDALANDILKLGHSEVGWDEVLLLVDVGKVGAALRLGNDRNSVLVFLRSGGKGKMGVLISHSHDEQSCQQEYIW